MIHVRTALSTCLLFILALPAFAATPQHAAEQLASFIDEVPGLGPGYAVVVVTRDEVLLNKTIGVRRASSSAPLTPDTPIYIASQTKAYMGLLAAVLDQRGTLPLDSTIEEYWPDLDLPGGLNAGDYTLRDLLTHQVPLSIDPIVNIEAYSARIDPADYPRLIELYAESRETGFLYDNLGYNLYSAILETVTGKTWQSWLDEVVFDPLGMKHTSARTSDFSLDELAWSHIWQGADTGWYEVRPKTDGKMQSAGGIVTSPNDMVTWLQLQLRGQGPEDSDITAAAVQSAQRKGVETRQEDGRNAYELPCTGYSLGWNICDFKGHEVDIHGGGYIGNRSMMAFSPDMGVGIAVFSNSDNMTGWFTSRTVNMFLQFLTDDPNAEKMRQIRIEQYPQRTAVLLERRGEYVREMQSDERWGGWHWQPDSTELAAYSGTWSTDEPYYDVKIEQTASGLVALWGEARIPLTPATPGLFAGQPSPIDSLSPFQFETDNNGRPNALDWDGRQYQRN